MESLAMFVVILMLSALLSGPVAIALTVIKTDSGILTFIRRIFHGLFVTMSLWIGTVSYTHLTLPTIYSV